MSTWAYYPFDSIEKSLVHCIWKVSGAHDNNAKEKILPKGTVEIIFNFSEPVYYLNSYTNHLCCLPRVFLNGINFKPFELNKTGRQEFIGIQLKPFGIKSLLGIQSVEFKDTVVPCNLISLEWDFLADHLFEINSFDGQVEFILKWVQNILSGQKKIYEIDRADNLWRCAGMQDITVKKLAAMLFVSERQLRRIAIDWMGMNTEELIAYSRYLNALQALHYNIRPLGEIALISGYYDQPHFIRDFRFFTEMTPGEYQKSCKGVMGHLIL